MNQPGLQSGMQPVQPAVQSSVQSAVHPGSQNIPNGNAQQFGPLGTRAPTATSTTTAHTAGSNSNPLRLGEVRSVSPKVKFDPFAPVITQPATETLFLDSGSRGSLFSGSSNPSSGLGQDPGRAVTDHPSFSKLWGKPGLTTTSVWG